MVKQETMKEKYLKNASFIEVLKDPLKLYIVLCIGIGRLFQRRIFYGSLDGRDFGEEEK
jgi:hypothetical protein